MPQKTIYVREEDLKIFEEAEELARSNLTEEDSLSSVIVASLNMYIQKERAKYEGYKKITVKTGISTDSAAFIEYIKFLGKEVAVYSNHKVINNQNLLTAYTLYQSSKGKFLLHVEEKDKAEGSVKSWHRLYDNIVDVEAPGPLLEKAQESINNKQTVVHLDI